MCNLYQHHISNRSIVDLTEAIQLPLTDQSRNRNYEPGYVGADQDGPILRRTEDGTGLEIASLRWGFPAIREKAKPITNIRNLTSRWWENVNGEYLREWRYRCLVPFSRFAEWDAKDKGNAWFTVQDEPSFFAGIWRPWRGARLKAVEGAKRRQRVEDDWQLYAFLTTEPNETVAAVHPKAMPVILTDPEDCLRWLLGGSDSLDLQRAYPNALTDRVS